MKNIWVPLSGAIAQQRNVDTIANNVANANTPGFKRDQLVFKEHLTAFSKGIDSESLPNKEWAPDDFYKSHGAENAQVVVDGSYTDFTQGQLRPTNNPLDLGLRGKGLFEVLTPNGVRYTRRGNFTISSQGFLVTDQGFPVLSKLSPAQLQSPDTPQPSARRIPVGSSRVSVNMQGEIFQNGQKQADLSVVEFNDLHALRKEGSSLFINKDNKNISTQPLASVIHQGFVEESNVNAVAEMSSLISATRHFESIQRALKAYDNMAQKGVNEIAKF